jgi:glycerophosphoryl diester phosphodiesterase
MVIKNNCWVFISPVVLLLGLNANAQSPAGQPNKENPSLALMREAWKHASAHGALQHPVISPDKADVFAGSVPIEELHREGFEVLPGTTADEKEMRDLIHAGADGMITDRPDVLQRVVVEELASATTEEAKKRLERFDIQGHRGARGLRPENTLPAYEKALDLGITTIELDTGVTRDKVSNIWHDQFVNPRSCRRADGETYTKKNQIYFSDISMAELQNTFVCDRAYFSPDQKNDQALSPVAGAFAKSVAIPDPYSPVSLGQLFKFIHYYEEYYRSGLGKGNPQAAFRVASAQRIRFDIETKLVPDYIPVDANHPDNLERTANHTFGPQIFVDVLVKMIRDSHMQGRCEIESFDFRTLRLVEEIAPEIPTYYLTGNRKLFPSQ